MTSINDLRAKFRHVAIAAERLFLLQADDAIAIINEASKSGVEGFRIFPQGGVQPRLEFSNDFADVEVPLESFVQSTIELVERGRVEGVVFDVVFEGASS